MKRGMLFEMELARRFLAESRGQTLLIIVGIGIGVAVMVFLSALIDGLQADLIQKTVGRSPHIVISNAEYAAADAVTDMNGSQVLLMDATEDRAAHRRRRSAVTALQR